MTRKNFENIEVQEEKLPGFFSFFYKTSKNVREGHKGLKIQYPAYKYSVNTFKMLLEFFVIGWIVLTITFFLVNAMPGESGLTAGQTESGKRAIEAQYGLSDPLATRYWTYFAGIFKGDFGVSFSLFPTKDINSFVWQRFGVSALVGMLSIAITLLIGIPLGIWVGKNPGKIVDNVSTIVIAILISVPSMVFGLLLLLMGKAIHLPYIFDIKNFLSYILPSFAIALGGVISYVRYIRTELNSELASMHAKFAYLKGASRSRFVWRHALKPALFPIATFFPIVVLNSFLGSLFIESIFNIPGAGGLMLNAIQAKDNNIILFLVVIYSLITILSFALRDVLYKMLDPRVRRS